MSTEFSPRMEYGRTEPHLRAVPGGVEAQGGPVTLTLRTPVPLPVEDGAVLADFDVVAGEVVEFLLAYSPTFGDAPDLGGVPSLERTLAGWTSWAAQHTGYDGDYPDLVRRSSLVLQGLTYGPSGAVVAAATTSLPETMGGELNFDYRYAWLRDLSLTIRSLWLAACPDEQARLFAWLAGSAGHVRDELVQIMYGVEGERDLSERVLEHLSGYRGSAPVRVGNQAWEQDQLDVFGEVLDAAHLLRDQLGDLSTPTQQLLIALANRAASTWDQPDAGMWEARDKRRHYTSSKVMCWVALDRAVDLAARLGVDADPDGWAKARDALRDAVLDQAWSEKAGAYTGAFGSDDIDASVLGRGAVLSRTSAALRGLEVAGVLQLLDGRTVTVSGVVDDAVVGGYEVALSTELGRELGVTALGYALVQAADGTTQEAVQEAVRQALPERALRIRAPGERPFARRGDEVLPQSLLKNLFGEFAIRRTGAGLTQDPSWAQENLVDADVPLLGRFRCHRRLVDALVPAMQEVMRRGLASTVRPGEFAGCHAVRAVRGASSLSRHAWGAAVDLNAVSNPLGAAPRIDARLVEVLEAHGLRWGGRFLRPDGQHFEGYGR